MQSFFTSSLSASQTLPGGAGGGSLRFEPPGRIGAEKVWMGLQPRQSLSARTQVKLLWALQVYLIGCHYRCQ